MTSQKSSKHAGWFTGRTRLITVVSIVAVAVAGASAVSANIGILDSASDTPVGQASVNGDLGTPTTQVVDVYIPTDRESGLVGMSERIRSAGGDLAVISTPGSGTTVHAALEVE